MTGVYGNLAMNPTRQNHEEELPGLQNETHGMLEGKSEKLHHVAWANECQGPTSAQNSIPGESQLASRQAVMVRLSFLTARASACAFCCRFMPRVSGFGSSISITAPASGVVE